MYQGGDAKHPDMGGYQQVSTPPPPPMYPTGPYDQAAPYNASPVYGNPPPMVPPAAGGGYYPELGKDTYHGVPAMGAPMPPMPPGPAIDQGVRFEGGQGWRDLPWAILFIVHFVIIFILAIVGGVNLKAYEQAPPFAGFGAIGQAIAGIVLVSVVVALVFGNVWLFLLRKFPAGMIWVTFVTSLLLNLAMVIFFFVMRSMAMGVIMIFVLAINLIFIILWRNRIAFSAILLRASVDVATQYPATTLVALCMCFVQFIFLCMWAFCFWAAPPTNNGALWALIIFLVFSFYWCSQVFSNTVHVTVAGTVASWYFLPNPSNPTVGALKRSLTTSFGSVCLGSLLVAILKTLRFIVQSVRNRNRGNVLVVILACCADCILGCLDNLMRYFNKFAYTQVAIYGKTFCEAARATFELLSTRGIDMIVNDSLVGPVLGLGGLIGGVICAIFSGVWAFGVFPQYWVAGALCGLVVGFVVVSIMLNVVDSAVTTMFVCYAEDPDPLARLKPELYTALTSADVAGRMPPV